MPDRLQGKSVLVTHASRLMGPAIVELFRAEGARVVADDSDLSSAEDAERAVRAAEPLDALIANLADRGKDSAVSDIRDEDWFAFFDSLVHPLMRVVRAAVPGMIERGRGKVIAITSAAPLLGRGDQPNLSAYIAARGAQNAFIRAVGLEVARHNVQVNAIAQNFVENASYFPPERLADPAFMELVRRNVPAQRVAKGWETAELALFLASDKSSFIVGQVIPFAGGWVT